ncbi:hypothetical protein ACFCT7_13650 [Fulvivirgaceae bacterium LMO-SS25]
MRYLIEPTPEVFDKLIGAINKIDFLPNKGVIDNQTILISLADANLSIPNRFSPLIKNTFGITQSIIFENEKFHLIIINEEFCRVYRADLVSVILHEIGHIINVFQKEISPLEARRNNISGDLNQINAAIRLENEFHADYIVKHCGQIIGAKQNLRNSLNIGFDDEELNLRIAALESNKIRLTNTIRTHTI